MDLLDIDSYDFYLPEELIAQTPLLNRSESKLLVLDKDTSKIKHDSFFNIIDYIDSNDVLVLNNTKVYPARLMAKKIDTLANIEVLLLKELGNDTWEVLVKPQKRVKKGIKLDFCGKIIGEIVNILDDGICHIKFFYEGIFLEILEEIGNMPLPPYIKEKLKDNDRYQTIYASNLGSAAAPTAGLHFTKVLLDKIKQKGVKVLEVTLDVGLGTFRPCKEKNILNHKMHNESYRISEDVADELNKAILDKKRIIACGTTTVRVLESNYNNGFKAGEFSTDIFIYPGYKFKVVDCLITNFHLPKSTLLMLTSAFTSRDLMLYCYNEAIKNNYRFFSFGDSMFITNKLK